MLGRSTDRTVGTSAGRGAGVEERDNVPARLARLAVAAVARVAVLRIGEIGDPEAEEEKFEAHGSIRWDMAFGAGEELRAAGRGSHWIVSSPAVE